MGRFTGISRSFVLVAGLMVAISGCDRAENIGRKVAHKSGDLIGKGATEFFSGVGEGVDAVKVKGPDVLTAISTRKSIRKFDASKPVEDEKVEKMLRAAMCAPTAMDKQASVGIHRRQGSGEAGGSRRATSLFACRKRREACDCRLRFA